MSLDANGTRKLSTGFLRDLSNLGILACFATRINFAQLDNPPFIAPIAAAVATSTPNHNPLPYKVAWRHCNG